MAQWAPRPKPWPGFASSASLRNEVDTREHRLMADVADDTRARRSRGAEYVDAPVLRPGPRGAAVETEDCCIDEVDCPRSFRRSARRRQSRCQNYDGAIPDLVHHRAGMEKRGLLARAPQTAPWRFIRNVAVVRKNSLRIATASACSAASSNARSMIATHRSRAS